MVKFQPTMSLAFLRPGGVVVDRFGNERSGAPVREMVPVVQWAVTPVEESAGDSLLRTVDQLQVFVPSGVVIDPAGSFELPDGTVWQVDGHGQDYGHGFHGWDPGVKVYTAKYVRG